MEEWFRVQGSGFRVQGLTFHDNGTLIYKATIPANTTATLIIPAVSDKSVTEGGKPAA